MKNLILLFFLLISFSCYTQDIQIKAIAYIAQDPNNNCSPDYDKDNQVIPTMNDFKERLEEANVGINVNYCIVEMCNSNYYDNPTAFTANNYGELADNVVHIYFRDAGIASRAPFNLGRILLTMNNDEARPYTLTHEFGHALGLYHGYQGLTWDKEIDDITLETTYTSSRCFGDNFGNAQRPVYDMYAPPHTDNNSPNDPLLFDSNNNCFMCLGACTNNMDNGVNYDSKDCKLIVNPNTTILCNNVDVDYSDPVVQDNIITNYMNQYECCASSFTPDQKSVMQNTALTFEIDPSEVDPNIVFIKDGEISTFTEWTSDKFIEGTLIVSDQLNIRGADIRFAPGASIWVQNGGILDIDDSNLFLYNGPLCFESKFHDLWRGIFLGDYIDQNDNVTQSPSGTNPRLFINNSQISKAEYGIYATTNSNGVLSIKTLNILDCNAVNFFDLFGQTNIERLFVTNSFVKTENSNFTFKASTFINTDLTITNSTDFKIFNENKGQINFQNSIITSNNTILDIEKITLTNSELTSQNNGELFVKKSLFQNTNSDTHITTSNIERLTIISNTFKEAKISGVIADASIINNIANNNFSIGGFGATTAIRYIQENNSPIFNLQCNYFNDNFYSLFAVNNTNIGNQGNSASAAGNIFNFDSFNFFDNLGNPVQYYHFTPTDQIPVSNSNVGITNKSAEDNLCNYTDTPGLVENGDEVCEFETLYVCWAEGNSACDGSGTTRYSELIDEFGYDYVHNSGCFGIIMIFTPCDDFDCNTDDIYNPCYILSCEDFNGENGEGNEGRIQNEINIEIPHSKTIESNVNIFPNPNTNVFSISLKDYEVDKKYVVEFVNFEGKHFGSFNLNNSVSRLDTNFPSGIYFSILKQNGKIIDRSKVIITQ